MTEQAKTILIGVFIIIACLSMIGILLFLRPSVGDNGKKLYVCFTSIDKISVGTRVTFAGKPVGEVIAIKEIYDARSQPTDRAGHVCFYELELAIDSHTVVYDTDEITIQTTGLLGERTIGIIPKAVKKGQPSYPVTDQVLYGKSGDVVEETLNQLVSVGSKASQMIDRISKLIDENEVDVHTAVKEIGNAAKSFTSTAGTITATAESVKRVFNQALETNLVGSINQAATEISSLSHSGTTLLNEFQEKGVGESFPAFSRHLAEITETINQRELLSQTLTNFHLFSGRLDNLRGEASQALIYVNSILKNIHCGKGTIGKLFSTDGLYVQVSNLFGKVDTLMNDINHYGILFHQNKEWQRERMKRIILLNRLCSPEDFRRYFEDEMCRVNLSLSRVALSIQRASEYGKRSCKNDCEFNCTFSELLNRLDNVEETLKLYRQHLTEPAYCPCN